jgi:pentatricopeptide repeat protein
MKHKTLFIYLLLFTLYSCNSTKNVILQDMGIRSLSEDDQREFYFHFYEGLRLKEAGQFAEAFESFQKCSKIDSTDTGLIVEIAFMQLATGKKEEALKGLQLAVKSEPDNWWYNTNLISLYIQDKKHEDAIAVGESLLKKYPEKEYTYNVLIQLYKETKRVSKAIALYEKLERITGINERIIFDKIRLYLIDNNIKKAHAEIDKLIQKFPKDSRYSILKGDMLMQQGKTQEAFALYESILKAEPQNPHVYVSLSEYYNVMNNHDKSLEYIIMALKNGQLDMAGKLEILGQHIEHIIKADGKIEETENLFNLLIDRYPLEEDVHGYYAAYLQYMKRPEEATVAYESMLNINPKNQQTWLSLIQIYFDKKEYDTVIRITDRAIDASDEKLVFYFYKGITLELTERYEEAIKTHTTALSLFKAGEKPELKSDVLAHLGDIYMKLEKNEDAFQAYEESVTINPNNLVALNNFAYYLSIEKKELQKAERMSAKTVEKEPRNSTYLDTYAWIFYQQENYSLAKFYIERAIDNLKNEQSPGVILEHYGDILWMLGDQDEKAIETWKKAYDSGHQSEELKTKIDNKGWNR